MSPPPPSPPTDPGADGRAATPDPRAAKGTERDATPRLVGTEETDDQILDEAAELADEAWHNLIGQDGYLPVLLMLFAGVVLSTMFGDSPLGKLLTAGVLSVALVATVYRSTHERRLRRAAVILVIVAGGTAVVATLLLHLFGLQEKWMAVLISIAYLILLLGAFPLVLIRSFQHRRVSINTVCATVSAYLLIGLIFTSVYRLSGLLAPPFFNQTGEPSAGEYSYFSFVTLTTVGYGDLTPATDIDRGLVLIEAVLGQVFLVTALARVVSLLGEERQVKALNLNMSQLLPATRTPRAPTADPDDDPGAGAPVPPTDDSAPADEPGVPDVPAPGTDPAVPTGDET